MRPNTIFAKNFIKRNRTLSSKVFFTGKSYKISVKKNILNFRFNKANPNILTGSNLRFINKNGQKKLYFLNAQLCEKTLKMLIVKVRRANTYTLRGLWADTDVLDKRTGRISEYM